jgi:nucleolar GTP-binding protein
VPAVKPSDEHLRSARKRAARVAASSTIKNEADRARNLAARQLDGLMKELSVPLTRYVSSFPRPGALHPFDAALLDLTVGERTYVAVLGRVDATRK